MFTFLLLITFFLIAWPAVIVLFWARRPTTVTVLAICGLVLSLLFVVCFLANVTADQPKQRGPTAFEEVLGPPTMSASARSFLGQADLANLAGAIGGVFVYLGALLRIRRRRPTAPAARGPRVPSR